MFIALEKQKNNNWLKDSGKGIGGPKRPQRLLNSTFDNDMYKAVV